MSNDMKRVGLVFDAQGVVDFKASLKSVNTALSENRSQFKLTKSTWDDTTKASEKLKATNEYLTKQYEDSAKKVSILTTELSELENAEKRDEQAISKKRAALNTAQTSMNNYKKGLEETSAKLKAGTADIEEYAKKLQQSGDKIKGVGTSLTKNVSAPLLAIGTAATLAWTKIDDAYDNIIAGTGATGDALIGLQNVFDEVYGSMPVEAMDASNAVADLNTRLGLTGDALSQASKDFLMFADVNKTDVSSAIALVTRAMGDASVPADEYNKILDALTSASQASGISIDKLTENLAKYGAPMRALGYTTQESIAIFAQWEKAGVNTEIAFSGMKKAISTWSAAGKDARVEFKKTLEEIASCPDIASATTKAIEVFGTKAGPDLADAIQGGRFSIEEMMKVVEESGGTLETTYNNMLDPLDKSKVAQNNLTLAAAELGNVIQSALGPIFETLSDTLKNITQWFKGLDDNIKVAIVTVGAIVAAIGPLLVIIGSLAGAISKIILLYTQFVASSASAGGATGLLSSALSGIMAPVLAVIALIGAVVGAVIELWNTNDEFRNAVTIAVDSLKELLNNIWTTVIEPIFNSIKEVVNDVWNNGVKPLWDNWVAFVGDISIQMAGLWESIQPILNWFIDSFGPLLVDIFNFVATNFGDKIAVMMNVAGALLSNIGEVVSGIIGVFKSVIDFIVHIFSGEWGNAWNDVVSIFRNIFDGIIGVAKAPINIIIGFINGLIGGVETGVNACIRALNHLSFDVPDWVPGIGGDHWGFDIGTVGFGRIGYLAKGGQLLDGMAMVAEAGPELLLQQGNRTTVAPLSNGGGATPVDIIDYEKLAYTLIRALKTVSVNLNDESLGKFVDKRLLKAVG